MFFTNTFAKHNVHADAHLSHVHDYDLHYLRYVYGDVHEYVCAHVHEPYHRDCVHEYEYANVHVYVAIQLYLLP